MGGAPGHGPAVVPAGLPGAVPSATQRHPRVPQTASGAETRWGALSSQHQTGLSLMHTILLSLPYPQTHTNTPWQLTDTPVFIRTLMQITKILHWGCL